jgi:hypothetical protein
LHSGLDTNFRKSEVICPTERSACGGSGNSFWACNVLQCGVSPAAALQAPDQRLPDPLGGEIFDGADMSPRFLLIALLAAFGFAALFATLTTVRQLHTHTSAVTKPLHRG